MDNIGERIVYCRKIIGLTQTELAKKLNLSLPTLQRWEANKVKLPVHKVESIVDCLSSYGVVSDTNWFMDGVGVAPINTKLTTITSNNFDEIAYALLTQLKIKLHNIEIKQIITDSFAPVLNYGDYAVVMPKSKQDLINIDNKLCYVAQNYEEYVGIFSIHNFYLKNTNNGVYPINTDKPYEIGEIIWIAKRFQT